MKRTVGASLLALAVAGGSSLAMAQGANSETPAQPPAATEVQPANPSDRLASDNDRDAVEKREGENVLTFAEASEWVGKRIYSEDGEDIGEISAVIEREDGNVEEFHADIGGFLGLGETTVRVEPSELSMEDDRLSLHMTGEEARELPRVEKE